MMNDLNELQITKKKLQKKKETKLQWQYSERRNKSWVRDGALESWI